MNADDYDGKRVAAGTWLYDGVIQKPVEVVAFDCDYHFDRLPGDDGRDPWEPYPLGPDGLLYYVRADGQEPLGFPPFRSLAEAQAWADAQDWAPITWES